MAERMAAFINSEYIGNNYSRAYHGKSLSTQKAVLEEETGIC